MGQAIRTLLVEADPVAASVLSTRLNDEVVGMAIDVVDRPDPSLDYEIYIFNTEYDGIDVGASLAKIIRKRQPNALILALSRYLDSEQLRLLVDSGCNGAYLRGSEVDVSSMVQRIRTFLARPDRRQKKGAFGVIHSMAELLKTWQRRLDHMESK